MPIEVGGIPEELIQDDNKQQEVAKDKPKPTSPHKGNIMATIRTRESLCIRLCKSSVHDNMQIIIVKFVNSFLDGRFLATI